MSIEPLGDRRRGFTLVELLVVIAIIAMLAGMLTAALAGARKSVRENAVRTELNALKMAMTQYYSDWGVYPPDFVDVDGDGYVDSGDLLPEECLVYFLGNTFRVSAGSGQVPATQNGGPYFEFPLDKLTQTGTVTVGGTTVPVYTFTHALGETGGVDFYRFDNNDDDGGADPTPGDWPDDLIGSGGWNMTNVNHTGVDVWSAGWDGIDDVCGLKAGFRDEDNNGEIEHSTDPAQPNYWENEIPLPPALPRRGTRSSLQMDSGEDYLGNWKEVD